MQEMGSILIRLYTEGSMSLGLWAPARDRRFWALLGFLELGGTGVPNFHDPKRSWVLGDVWKLQF